MDSPIQGYRVPGLLDIGTELLLYEANNTEEPCARKPHAGICEGAVGKLAVLPRWVQTKTNMKSRSFTVVSLSLFQILLLSSHFLHASENIPHEKLKIIGLSLFPPAGEHWHTETVHPARIQFGKLGNDKLESFLASAVIHKLPAVASEEEFLKKISEGRWGEKRDQVRFKNLVKEENISHEKGALCIRYHSKYEDYGSKYLTKDIPFFIVEDIGLICRHPMNNKIGVSIGVSQRARPGKLMSNFNELANDFLLKAEFDSLPDDL